jgi:hypothetical protein
MEGLTERWPDRKAPSGKSSPVQAASEPVDTLAFPTVEVGHSPMLAANDPEIHGVYPSERSDELENPY